MLSPCLLAEAVPGHTRLAAGCMGTGACHIVSLLPRHVHMFQGCQKCKGFQPYSQTTKFVGLGYSTALHFGGLSGLGSCKVGMQRFLLCPALELDALQAGDGASPGFLVTSLVYCYMQRCHSCWLDSCQPSVVHP